MTKKTDNNDSLFTAAKEGNVEKIKSLIKAGADAKAKDQNNGTPKQNSKKWLRRMPSCDFLLSRSTVLRRL